MTQSLRRRYSVPVFFITTLASLAAILIFVNNKGLATNTFTFTANNDTYVSSVSPASSFGTKLNLYADGSPDVKSIVGFSVNGLNGAKITGATLKIYGQSANSGGIAAAIYSDNNWTETGLTYNSLNKAAIGPQIATYKPVTAGQWASLNVTPAVTGEGNFSFAILPVNTTNTKFESREAGPTTAPQLVVTTDSATTSSPTVSLNANPVSITSGQSSTLTWSSSNSDSCTASGGWSGIQPTNGSVSTGTLNQSTTYTLMCSGAGGTATASTTVNVNSVASSDPVVVADGDSACDPAASGFNGGNGTSKSCMELTVSNLAISLKPDAVLALGDNVYECGGLKAFQNSYGPSWGRLLSITHPAVGNHEYITGGTINGVSATDCDTTGKAMGYFNYFGTAAGSVGQGYYSFDLGAWHLISLNSNCGKAGGCKSGSPQYTWLQNDLQSHSTQCTLAYFHHPLYSRDTSGGTASLSGQPFWQLLYNAGAELVLNGHSHNYQRFQPMNATGGVDNAKGILEFVSGEGGANVTPLDVTDSPSAFAAKYSNVTPGLSQPNPLTSYNAGFGVLELMLHAQSYDWKFIPINTGAYTDSGTGSCH